MLMYISAKSTLLLQITTNYTTAIARDCRYKSLFLCLRHYMVLWTWDSDLHQHSCLAFLLLPSLLGYPGIVPSLSTFLPVRFRSYFFAEVISSSAAGFEACTGSLSNLDDFVGGGWISCGGCLESVPISSSLRN
ncbi:hypothetical protein Tco_0068833 [Tanacetum coccineum]